MENKMAISSYSKVKDKIQLLLSQRRDLAKTVSNLKYEIRQRDNRIKDLEFELMRRGVKI